MFFTQKIRKGEDLQAKEEVKEREDTWMLDHITMHGPDEQTYTLN